MRKEIEPPYKPLVTGPEDTRNIDKMFTNEPARDSPDDREDMMKSSITHFDKFTYEPSSH